MADTGFNWGAWQAMQISSADWTANAVADNATDTGDALDLDGFAACEVAFSLTEDNTGAIDGVATIFILGGGVGYEETTTGSPFQFTITPVQNDIVYKRFNVDPADYGDFKIAIFNEGGQELAVTVKYRTATIPRAS